MGELDLSGKTPGASDEKRPRGRPSSDQKHRELRADLKASIVEIADWLGEEEMPEPATLGDLIRKHADEMADVLAVWAEKNGIVEKVIRRLVGKGGPLSALRAFGPLARRLVVEPLRARQAALYDDELPPDPDAPLTGFTPAG